MGKHVGDDGLRKDVVLSSDTFEYHRVIGENQSLTEEFLTPLNFLDKGIVFMSGVFMDDDVLGGNNNESVVLHGFYFLSYLRCFPQPCDYIIA